jgi:hypothetical protein
MAAGPILSPPGLAPSTAIPPGIMRMIGAASTLVSPLTRKAVGSLAGLKATTPACLTATPRQISSGFSGTIAAVIRNTFMGSLTAFIGEPITEPSGQD